MIQIQNIWVIQIQKIQVYGSIFGISHLILPYHPYLPHSHSKILISLISPSLPPNQNPTQSQIQILLVQISLLQIWYQICINLRVHIILSLCLLFSSYPLKQHPIQKTQIQIRVPTIWIFLQPRKQQWQGEICFYLDPFTHGKRLQRRRAILKIPTVRNLIWSQVWT